MLPHEMASEEAAMAAAHDGNPVWIHHACARSSPRCAKSSFKPRHLHWVWLPFSGATLGYGGVEGSKAVLDIERADAARQRLHTVLAKPQRAPDRPPRICYCCRVLAYHVKTHEPQQPWCWLKLRASEHT